MERALLFFCVDIELLREERKEREGERGRDENRFRSRDRGETGAESSGYDRSTNEEKLTTLVAVIPRASRGKAKKV